MREKTVDLTKFGYSTPLVLKKMTFGETCDYNDELEKKKAQNNGAGMEGYANIQLLKRMIKEAPFPLTDEGIRALDSDVALTILKEAVDLVRPLES
jgi:hypothetical protein